MNPLSALYGRVTRLRRAWYDRHPDRRRHLAGPVISVGNIASGGSGKTPVVAFLARLLCDAGERPAILSRGYGRRRSADGVLVVSEGGGPIVTAGDSGDEPQMLARWLRGVPVLVSRDRGLAGRLAEHRFATTVSLLDDGFQHVQLGRDIDLVLVSPEDLDDQVLPSGRLREPLEAAARGDALLVPGTEEEVRRVTDAVGHRHVFRVSASYGEPRQVDPFGAPAVTTRRRVLAVAAIARPRRFFDALRGQGWDVATELTYRDHHWFSARDVRAIDAAARKAGVDVVMTTEKDAVRLDAAVGPAWLFLPMEVTIEPLDPFRVWISSRLAAVRLAHRSAEHAEDLSRLSAEREEDLSRRSAEREGG